VTRSVSSLRVAAIGALYAAKGGRMYSGEPVTQLEHALQSAWLAERAGASAALVSASLLHDIGHMTNDKGETPTERGIDDLHQYHALAALRGTFPEEVLEPIRWHVDAKRYLCRARPEYYASLSPDSKRSLVLQGGIFSVEEADGFAARPWAQDAVNLRLWDDLAKVAGERTPDWAHFEAILARVASSS
jgi:phosphonate degradation associated HDIG domain protein